MTIEQFVVELKSLLRKAEDAGLDVEELCTLAEHVLENGWSASTASKSSRCLLQGEGKF